MEQAWHYQILRKHYGSSAVNWHCTDQVFAVGDWNSDGDLYSGSRVYGNLTPGERQLLANNPPPAHWQEFEAVQDRIAVTYGLMSYWRHDYIVFAFANRYLDTRLRLTETGYTVMSDEDKTDHQTWAEAESHILRLFRDEDQLFETMMIHAQAVRVVLQLCARLPLGLQAAPHADLYEQLREQERLLATDRLLAPGSEAMSVVAEHFATQRSG